MAQNVIVIGTHISDFSKNGWQLLPTIFNLAEYNYKNLKLWNL